jgi:hypothetical protein
MLSAEVKRRAMAQAQELKISFADFVRQAIIEKLPHQGKGVDRLKRRREDPLFRLLDRLPLVNGGTATDVAGSHDDYLYVAKPQSARG